MSFFGNAEKLFNEGVADGWKMAKARATPKHQIFYVGDGGVKLKPNEVLARLEIMGIKISGQTLLNYRKLGLIPMPRQGGHGRAKGRYAYYPEETPAFACATYQLINGTGFKVGPQKLSSVCAMARNGELLSNSMDLVIWMEWVYRIIASILDTDGDARPKPSVITSFYDTDPGPMGKNDIDNDECYSHHASIYKDKLQISSWDAGSKSWIAIKTINHRRFFMFNFKEVVK